MPLSRRLAALSLLCLALALPGSAMAQGFRLLMVDSPTCPYCWIFERDIAPIYDVAPEGRAAPLIRMRLGADPPEGVRLAFPAFVTPTFVLLGPDGAERDRLIGYPGEEYFWVILERMFARAGVPVAPP